MVSPKYSLLLATCTLDIRLRHSLHLFLLRPEGLDLGASCSMSSSVHQTRPPKFYQLLNIMSFRHFVHGQASMDGLPAPFRVPIDVSSTSKTWRFITWARRIDSDKDRSFPRSFLQTWSKISILPRQYPALTVRPQTGRPHAPITWHACPLLIGPPHGKSDISVQRA